MGVIGGTKLRGAESVLEPSRESAGGTWLHAQEILSMIADAVVIANQEGGIVLFNQAAEDMFGYSRAEVLGAPVEILIPSRFREAHSRSVASFSAGDLSEGRRMGARRQVVGRRKDGTEFLVEASVSRRSVEGRTLVTAVVRDGTERQRHVEAQALVASEMSHRFKNVIAVVSSIVRLTGARAGSVPAFSKALLGRLATLARTHDILLRDRSSAVPIQALLEAELAPYRTVAGPHISLRGPAIELASSAAVNLGLVLHELATNAAKYGALSMPTGRLWIDWNVASAPGEARLMLDWRETGGPPVSPPARRGFGTELIERCSVRPTLVEYDEAGFRARLAFRLGTADRQAAPAGSMRSSAER